MDTIKALSSYRKSIASDERAFEVLCLLYKNARASEDELIQWTGIERRKLKPLVRELFQANLLRANSESRLYLTSLAETALSEMEIDSLIVPTLVAELTTSREAKRFILIFDWISNNEPDLRRSTVSSLRNLSALWSAPLTDNDRRELLWQCAVHPDSTARFIFKDTLATANSRLFGSSDESTWVEALSSANSAARALDKMDQLFAQACTGTISKSQLTDNLLSKIAFRYINYATSSDRDYVLETYQSRLNASARLVLQGAILDKFPSILQTLEPPTKTSKFNTYIRENDFFAIIDDVVTTKSHLNQRASRYSTRSFHVGGPVTTLPFVGTENRKQGSSSIDELCATINRAIAQAEEMNIPSTLQLLMMARLEVDLIQIDTEKQAKKNLA